MEILFTSPKMAKLCSSQKEMRAKLGTRGADKLQERLAQLAAAASLEDMKFFPAARCHELAQNRAGQIAVDLVHPYRLIFEPAHEPLPEKPSGGLDRSKVTRIIILEITDYH